MLNRMFAQRRLGRKLLKRTGLTGGWNPLTHWIETIGVVRFSQEIRGEPLNLLEIRDSYMKRAIDS